MLQNDGVAFGWILLNISPVKWALFSRLVDRILLSEWCKIHYHPTETYLFQMPLQQTLPRQHHFWCRVPLWIKSDKTFLCDFKTLRGICQLIIQLNEFWHFCYDGTRRWMGYNNLLSCLIQSLGDVDVYSYVCIQYYHLLHRPKHPPKQKVWTGAKADSLRHPLKIIKPLVCISISRTLF